MQNFLHFSISGSLDNSSQWRKGERERGPQTRGGGIPPPPSSLLRSSYRQASLMASLVIVIVIALSSYEVSNLWSSDTY